MDILLANPRGFCAGVDRAIDIVERVLDRWRVDEGWWEERVWRSSFRLITRDGLLVVDEAYADFAEHNALELLPKYDNIVITRTLSKSYSLAGMRTPLGPLR